MIKKILIFALLFWGNVNSAQQTGEEKFGSWLLLSVKNQLTEKLSVGLTTQKRFYEFLDNGQSVFGLISFSYKLNNKLTLTEGFGYLESKPFSKEPGFPTTFERRIYEQLSYNESVDRLQINQQYQMEHRWIGRRSNTDYESRFRYKLWLRYPLNHKAMVPNTLFLSSFDEIMFNFQGDAFNQNRLFGGLGYQFDKNIRFEAGYMKNSFRRRNFDRIWLMLYINTDLRKTFKKHANRNS